MTDVTPEAQAEPTEPTTDAPETEAPQLGIDPALDARLNELGQSIGQLTQGFQQLQEAQYEDPYQQPYQDPYQQQQDPYGGLDPNDPRDQQIIQMQQALQSQQQQTEQMAQQAYERDLQGLTQRIPELDKPEVAEPVVNAAKATLQHLGMDPNGRIPISLLEMAFGKYRADQIAAGQQPISQVQQGQATLEGAGASPQQPQQDPLDEYFPAGQQDPGNVFGIRR